MIAATIQCVYACALLLFAEVRGLVRLRIVAKTVASFDFVAVGLIAQDGSSYAQWIIVGLVLGAVGDVCFLGAGRRWFTIGLVAFLLGHLAYVVAIAQIVPPGEWLGLSALLPIAGAVFALVRLRPHLGS
ncbi:MAG TPA: lysoplasmalogenase family protein, partial [Kofleriaceae bacterium]|nr:lysoplasmalogenase family protein [Kofleriaceae bacterium]